MEATNNEYRCDVRFTGWRFYICGGDALFPWLTLHPAQPHGMVSCPASEWAIRLQLLAEISTTTYRFTSRRLISALSLVVRINSGKLSGRGSRRRKLSAAARKRIGTPHDGQRSGRRRRPRIIQTF